MVLVLTRGCHGAIECLWDLIHDSLFEASSLFDSSRAHIVLPARLDHWDVPTGSFDWVHLPRPGPELEPLII